MFMHHLTWLQVFIAFRNTNFDTELLKSQFNRNRQSVIYQMSNIRQIIIINERSLILKEIFAGYSKYVFAICDDTKD